MNHFIKRVKFYAKRLFWLVLFGGFAVWLLDTLFPLSINLSYSQVILSAEGKVLNGFLSKDDKWRMKTELNEISPQLERAFIAKEDQYFYYHLGINPLAIGRAIFHNILEGKKTSGASTITMQVVRLLAPKERSYLNKIIEMLRAVQLELHYSKAEILQLYLNLVPYGSNLEGIKAASLLYFNCLPSQLSLAQITALAIVPNRPTSLALGKNEPLLTQERNKWLERFGNEGVFDSATIAHAKTEPLNAKRYTLPKVAPHFANWVHLNMPYVPTVSSTIQGQVQQKVEQLAYQYSQKMQVYGIYNAAVLVVDNKTRHVIAYLGSPDFGDTQHAGQVDGVWAYRSPGSALKPLIYGIAFDKGLLTPKTTMEDLPTDFSGYAPENYNRTFNGVITVETALANSLNVPAVKLLDQMGVFTLTNSLKQAGFQLITKNEKKLGLSLALGGCGVNLWEMAGLYVALANAGVYQPLSVLQRQPDALPDSTEQNTTVVSAATAYMLTDILSKVQRPEMPSDYEHNPDLPPIAWKTGTSYGRRDAWSIGYNAKYTVAVWLGNADNAGSPELVGASVATPLLFKLFNIIDYQPQKRWFFQPESLRTRQVCSHSGKVPQEFCKSLVTDFYIPSVSDNKKCEHLKYVFVAQSENISYCAACLPESGYKRKLYPNTSPELRAFYQTNQILYEKLPPHNPQCQRLLQGQAPKIVSPLPEREYLSADNEGVQLLLACNTDTDVKQVFWYINDQFFKAVSPQEKVFFNAPKGRVKISCSDDLGRNTNIYIQVK